MVPLWWRGGFNNWNDAIHAIFFFYNNLSNEERLLEAKKSSMLTHAGIQFCKKQIKHLHENRLYINGRKNLVDLSTLVFNNTTYNTEQVDIITGIPCYCCGFVLCEQIKNCKEYKERRSLHPNSQCLQCIAAYLQKRSVYIRNNSLSLFFNSQVVLRPAPLDKRHTKSLTINIKDCIEGELGCDACRGIISLLGGISVVKLKVIYLPEYIKDKKKYKKCVVATKGAECKLGGLHTHPNLISFDNNDDQYDATILLFPNRSGETQHRTNFICCFNNGYTKEDARAYTKNEESIISQNILHRRGSTASGVPTHPSQCESMNTSTIRDDPRSFFFSTKTGVYLKSIQFKSGSNQLYEWSGAYKDQHGSGMSSTKKYKHAKNSYFRNMILQEALALIKTVACLSALGIPPKRGDRYMNELSKLLRRRMEEDVDVVDDVDLVSRIEDILVEYMCSWPEFRNYSPVACHVDGMKNSDFEVLGIFDREGCCTERAYLYFPLDNSVQEFVVNRTIGVCHFDDTVHVADPIRGGGNTSRATWSKA